MANMTDTFWRISLAFLLLLLLAGLVGHWISAADDFQHESESACAFHAGILIPEIPQSQVVEMHVFLQPAPGNIIALCLGGKISHPPTL